MEINDILHKSLSSRSFKDGIHSLLKLSDARESADIILPYVMQIASLRVGHIVIDVKK